jgi:Uncharacterized protein conserved in bacteria
MLRDLKLNLLLSCLLVALPLCAEQGLPSPPHLGGPSADRHSHRGDRPAADSTGALFVRVVGLNSNDGTVRIEIDTAQSYGSTGNVRLGELPIQNRTVRWTLPDVPYGTYAVALYHDQNDNDELDTDFLGRPKEPYGFSNNARGTMGPPDFEEAAFTLSSDSLSLTISAK